MRVFAISDLHLSINNPKPMDIFGERWEGYIEKIFADWKDKVSDEDLVLLAGDFSWAMKLEDTKPDFQLISALPGKKIIIRGNHDYWWSSISAVRNFLPQDIFAVQNDAMKFGNYVICGTRGWTVPEKGVTQTPEDEKIFKREIIRLEMSLQSASKLKKEGDKVICMMHYPPCNFKREDSEFTALLEKYQVDAVVYGHLHGYKKSVAMFTKNNVPYYLTSCDMVLNRLVEIDV